MRPPRKLTPLLQPFDSHTCMQTSVAMVAGVTLDQAIRAFKQASPSAGTEDVDVEVALRRLGVKFGAMVKYKRGPRERSKQKVPDFCLAGIRDNRTLWGHAVAILDGFVYDPAIGWAIPIRAFEDIIIKDAYSKKTVKARWEYFIPILSKPPPGRWFTDP